jgi:hypothetical protein
VDPEAYLHALTVPPAPARPDRGATVARFSLEAVANAFVILGLLPAERAEQILTAQRPVRQAAGFRVGLEIGELSLSPGARAWQQARAAPPGSLRGIPRAIAIGPARWQFGGHGFTIETATLTAEGIWLRYRGDAVEGGREAAGDLLAEITGAIAALSIADDAGGTYRVPAASVGRVMSGRRSASGRTRWIPEGEVLAVPSSPEAGTHGVRAVRWVEFSAGAGQPVRAGMPSPAVVLTGTTAPPWPTPAECYLAQFAPPSRDWSVGSSETGTVTLDTTAIVAAVTDALLAVGALPPDSSLLTGLPDSVRGDWRLSLGSRQRALTDTRDGPGQVSTVGLAVRLPLNQATAVLETVTAREDLVSVQLYGHPWVMDESWPMITPCFRVTATDDTGVAYEGEPGSGSWSAASEGRGAFWFWPPVGPQARQLRLTVSTLWEAAWALIDIPGR